jgi:hypothetical protein
VPENEQRAFTVQFPRLVVPFDSGGGVLGLVLRSAPARQTVEGYGRSGGQAPSRKRSLRHNRGAGMRPISSTVPILPPWVNPDFAGEPWCRRLEGDLAPAMRQVSATVDAAALKR